MLRYLVHCFERGTMSAESYEIVHETVEVPAALSGYMSVNSGCSELRIRYRVL